MAQQAVGLVRGAELGSQVRVIGGQAADGEEPDPQGDRRVGEMLHVAGLRDDEGVVLPVRVVPAVRKFGQRPDRADRKPRVSAPDLSQPGGVRVHGGEVGRHGCVRPGQGRRHPAGPDEIEAVDGATLLGPEERHGEPDGCQPARRRSAVGLWREQPTPPTPRPAKDVRLSVMHGPLSGRRPNGP
jgi:hypothetical protein